MQNFTDKLRGVLAQRPVKRIQDKAYTPAAVLVPLFIKNNAYHLLLIQRTTTMRMHKGQISFPGGAFESSDNNLLTTALRESCEEIGLQPKDVDVLGQLDDEVIFLTKYVISPYVGLIPYPYQFCADGIEVAELLEVPVADLLDERIFSRGTLDNGHTTYTYLWNGKNIWGGTARIIKGFLDIWKQVDSNSKVKGQK